MANYSVYKLLSSEVSTETELNSQNSDDENDELMGHNAAHID